MNLERAIEIAVSAHKGVKDKGGNPYILHPLRVMLSLNSEEEKIVGVLHDVVEDAEDWTFEKLQDEGFSTLILEGLKSVTKTSEDENYNEFVQRALANTIGRQVKIADIKDNLDVTRLDILTEKDVKRIQSYKKSLKILQSGI
jgi:(p)ppGpp synthase/HD superfamily hydrolase